MSAIGKVVTCPIGDSVVRLSQLSGTRNGDAWPAELTNALRWEINVEWRPKLIAGRKGLLHKIFWNLWIGD